MLYNKASKRCFICEVANDTIIANSNESLRICAMVVGIHCANEDEIVLHPGDEESPKCKFLSMILDDGTSIIEILSEANMLAGIHPGRHIDCTLGLRQRGNARTWYAKSIFPVGNSMLELLRWMELSSGSKSNMNHGYATVRFDASEVLQMISQNQSEGGISLRDLAMVLQVSTEQVQEKIVELQLDGQIYQNQEGGYVPL